MNNKAFAVLMAIMISIAPLAMDGYIPALPDMAIFLHKDLSLVATTVSIFTFGMAIGQLIGGPLSDKYGRYPMILSGLLLYISSSLIITMVNHFPSILLLRFTEALGGGFVMVCVMPLIRSRVSGNEAAKLLSLIGLITVIAPAIAPSLGSLILMVTNWHGIFYFLALYGFFALFAIYRYLPKDNSRAKDNQSVIQRYKHVLENKLACRYMYIRGASFSVLLIVLTNGSFIYQRHFGLSPTQFSIVFSLNVVAMAIINRINNRLLDTCSSYYLLSKGVKLLLVNVLLMIVFIYFNASIYLISATIILTVGSLGMISPNLNAIFISYYSKNTGSASALMGAFQALTGALIGALSTLLNNGTLWPMVISLLLVSITANIIQLRAKKAEENVYEKSFIPANFSD
ncbi:multidrug effflux MFS transporter [Vibrio sp. SS-MA-C1-2]|uniref:multidrug effflux MFS transporter n=1 Tax=Vibrio sp. SS-MA-C1-2 TaxID=2908646 RepID=UPI001F432512|nr:multidrug effflux MFS transporter [Vibrio sp. SS-MA-C1-2]UJF17042.1 multidrug effflux MFS transporter [Vibrio sp. SS-MA-C1-2]